MQDNPNPNAPMEFVPQTTPTITPPQPTYELKSDVTGKELVKRGVFILKDKNGTEIKCPYPPKKKCKKCYGRGFIGTNAITGRLIICRKCYPMINK